MSDLWCQIHADVMDRTIEKVVEPLHAQLRGAAILAGLSLGLVDRSEVRDLVGVERTFTPIRPTATPTERQYAEFPKALQGPEGHLQTRLTGGGPMTLDELRERGRRRRRSRRSSSASPTTTAG